jgi:ubiquinone/menaquinone biosynthesis C-methylase UbiE
MRNDNLFNIYAEKYNERKPSLQEKEKERTELYRQKALDRLKTRQFILHLAHHLRSNILEIGAGRGYTTLTLAKLRYEVGGVDNDEEMLKITALNLTYYGLLRQVRLFKMDATSLLFEDLSFNNIITVDVFHHLKEPKQIL